MYFNNVEKWAKEKGIDRPDLTADDFLNFIVETAKKINETADFEFKISLLKDMTSAIQTLDYNFKQWR